MTFRKAVLLLAVLLLATAPLALAQGTTVVDQARVPPTQNPPTTITTCGTAITTPGIYTVALTSLCEGNGIEINASGVTLQMIGTRIESACIAGCSSTQTGIVVSDPSGGPISNVKILGGVVADFAVGASFAGVSHSQVTGVTISDFSTTCFSVGNDSQGDGSQNDTFTANQFIDCGTAFEGNSVSNSKFIGNLCSGYGTIAGVVGIQILNGDDNVLTGNTVYDHGTGIELGGTGSSGATGNVLNGNSTTSNSTGILVGPGANANSFAVNYSYGNTTFDIDDENARCGTDTWRMDAFSSANQRCVH
jgi:hypothetical protein